MLVRLNIRAKYKSTCRSLIERGRDSRWLLKRLRASSPLISEMVVGRFVSLLWDRVILVRWVTRDKGEIYSVISDILGRRLGFITVLTTVRSLMIIGSVLVTWHYCQLVTGQYWSLRSTFVWRTGGRNMRHFLTQIRHWDMIPAIEQDTINKIWSSR